MARYIKANPKVVQYLHLENERNMLKDGNYILWLQDLITFGPLPMLADTLQQIGGIALMPHEAREEQDGTVTRPLPQATDPRFIVETAEPETEAPAGESETDGQQAEGDTPETPTDANSEAPAEETAQSNDEVESIDSGDVGSVDEVLNANDKEE